MLFRSSGILPALAMFISTIHVVCETPVANDFISLHNGYRYTVLEGNDDFVVSVNIGVSKKAESSYLEKLNASLGKISQSEREAMMTQITTR